MKTIKICEKPHCENIYRAKDPWFKSKWCECGGKLLKKTERQDEALDVNKLDINKLLDLNTDLEETVIEEVFEENNLKMETEDIYKEDDLNVNKKELYKDYPDDTSISTVNKNDFLEEKYGQEKINRSTEKKVALDSKGNIIFIDNKEVQDIKEDKLVVYLSNQIYKEIPLEYDEIIIGRLSSSFEPDVDLSEIDIDRNISRKHLMIYRKNGNLYARNLSTKNSVHVQNQPLMTGEDKKLNDDDIIILSRYLVIRFKSKDRGSF